MNLINQFLLKKLSVLHKLIDESNQLTYLNTDIVWITNVCTRFSYLLLMNQFCEKEYMDDKLILLKNIINWATLLTPIKMIDSYNLQTVTLIFIVIFHWLAVLIFLGFYNRLLEKFSTMYYTYFQILLLYPSFSIINYSIYNNVNIAIIVFAILPIVINYIVFTYLQRNYSLQVRNHYVRRYKLTNYLIMITDFLVLLSLPAFSENYQTPILILVYFVQVLDSIFIQPYTYIMNKRYCLCSSIMFYGSIFKQFCCYFGDDSDFFYFSLLIIPPLSFVCKKCMLFLSNQSYDQPTTKEFIISITDQFYCGNDFIKLIILYQLRCRFKIKNNNIQFHKYVQQMFSELVDQLNPSDRYKDENLYLYKILFLKRNNKNQNLGYIKMKKLQVNNPNRSLYFQIIENNFTFVQPIEQNSNSHLDLTYIRNSEKLQEESFPKGIIILEQKLQFWESLLSGYTKIEEFSETTIKFCKKVDKLKSLIFNTLNLQINSLSNELTKLNIIELRLLSFLFGAILNDYHITLEIEQTIDKLLSYERNVQTINIINTTLLYDNVIITSISMIKNPGEILNKNRKQLQKFFQFPNENTFLEIKHINQLLPDYLKTNHNSLMNRFLASGESELFSSSRFVFPVCYTGFAFKATIQLMHFFEFTDDYVIAAVLRKVVENNDFIIFDSCGKIIGISESVYQLLVFEENNQIKKTLFKSYIFFWFPDLIQQINENFNENSENQMEIDKVFTFTIQPILNLENVVNEYDIFKKQNQNQYTSTNTIRTEQDLAEETQQAQQTKKFPCFEENYIQQILDFTNSYLKQDCEIYYSLQLRVLLHKFANHFPIFHLQIQDFQQRGNRKSKSGYSLGTLSLYQTQQFSTKLNYSNLTNFNADLDELHQEFKVNQSIVNKLLQNKKSGLTSVELKKINDSLNMMDNQKSIDFRESNLISPRSNRDILIQNEILDEDEDEIQGKESHIDKSSSQKDVKEDIADVILRERNADQKDQQDLIKSKSSTTSGTLQNSIYNLIRKLQYTDQIQSSIVKALWITNALALLIFAIITAELNILRQNTSELQFNIPLVRIPQRFNRLYCTFITLGQLDLQQKLLNLTYGDYYSYRIKNFSAETRNELDILMLDLKNNFALLESKGKLPEIQVRIINEYIFQVENMTMIQFDSMINEYTEKIDQQIQYDNDLNKILILLEFLKGNLLNYLALTISVVEQIEAQFFSLIDSNETDYFTFLIVLLLIIFLLLTLQLKYWQKPYKYIQQILLLIAKISEKDIDQTCIRIYFIMDKINRDPLLWKHINYYRDLFWINRVQSLQSARMTQKMMSISQQTHKKQQRAKQTSRVLETSFSILNIWMILLFLWLILSGFVLSCFLIIKTNMDNSQPVLQLTMQYVKFKQDLDGVMIICQLLKNQQLLVQETIKRGIFNHNSELSTQNKYFDTMYNEMLLKFSPLVSEIEEIYFTLYNDLTASEKLSDSNKAYLLNLYQNNLCDIIPKSLPFCSYINGSFTYFPTYPAPSEILDNKLIFKYGINGIYQQIKNIFNSHYSLELNDVQETNLTIIQEFLESSEYIQVILPYFFDLSFAILEFYYSILKASIDMLETDYETGLIYFTVCGVTSVIILYLTIFIRAYTLQRNVKFIRQALIIIPHESLQDQSVMNIIKRIERNI